MKILFIGDFSNLHACMADALQRLGHSTTIVSNGGGYMKTRADHFIVRKPGFIGAVKYLYNLMELLPHLKGYDIVQFNNPHFFDLRPGKLRYFFNEIKKNNGKVCFTLASNDYFFVKSCLDGTTFRFSEFRIGRERSPFSLATPSRENGWTRQDVGVYNQYFYDNIDAGLSILPEYDIAAKPILGDRLHFINLPVDLSVLPYSEPNLSDSIKLFIGLSVGREVQKGTDILLQMARKLCKDLPGKCSLTEARNMPLNEYLKAMSSANIHFDQLYSYSPATNALQAMAFGAVSVSGAQPEYYQYINESSRPIIEASPLRQQELYEQLHDLILNPEPLLQMSADGRRIVETHNDSMIIANKCLNIWQNL